MVFTVNSSFEIPAGIQLFIVKIKKLEQGVNMFLVNNKDTRTTKLALFLCHKQISHLALVLLF